jgi:hypothetical protein
MALPSPMLTATSKLVYCSQSHSQIICNLWMAFLLASLFLPLDPFTMFADHPYWFHIFGELQRVALSFGRNTTYS